MNQNLYLLGMPLSGKSSVGKGLALALGVAFEDLDQTLEAETGRKIPDIFTEDGEPAFRDLETQMLLKSEGPPWRVLATGGGVVVREKNIEFLKNHLSVFLDNPLEQLIDRGQSLIGQGEDLYRPLLKGDNWQDRLKTLHEARQDLYLKTAGIVVPSRGTPLSMVEDILARLKESGK